MPIISPNSIVGVISIILSLFIFYRTFRFIAKVIRYIERKIDEDEGEGEQISLK